MATPFRAGYTPPSTGLGRNRVCGDSGNVPLGTADAKAPGNDAFRILDEGDCAWTISSWDQPLALVLLRKLAADADYRKRYECNPVQALREIGVPEKILRDLPPGHQEPIKLADPPIFQEALYQVIDQVAAVCVCHSPPQVKLAVGSPASKPRTSFGTT